MYLYNLFTTFVKFLSLGNSGLDFITTAQRIVLGIVFIIGLLELYRVLFIVLSFFGKGRKFLEFEQDKKYAILIPARNESLVIGNLIKSIQKQTYNQDLITIFVVADNCSDNTALIARNLRCVVYERFDNVNKTKGFALQFLMTHIERDYKISSFDGFFVFDADNLLAKDFVEKMHNAFSTDKVDVVTSYRNIKNFNTNIISASYGIHFYRNNFINHRPRSILNSSTNITGTGFLVGSDFLKDGWKWTGLTEDAEITISLIIKNKKIMFCEEANIYDEQPTDFKTMSRQRLRWARGRIVAFFRNWLSIIKSFIIKPSFSKYDLFFSMFPLAIFSFLSGLIFQIITTVYFLSTTGEVDLLQTLMGYIILFGTTWVMAFITGVFVLIRERKHFGYKIHKIVWFLFWWPMFDTISPIIESLSVFLRVKWTPIIHDDSTSIDDIEK